MKKYFFILTLAMAFASCNNSKKDHATEEPEMKSKTETESSDTNLSGKDWKLVMLNGKPLVLDSEIGSPHIKFENTEQVSGNLGCNNFGGGYKAEGNEISFSKIVATQMACANLKVEQSFLELLNTAKKFHISNDTLTLDNGTSVAKLTLQ